MFYFKIYRGLFALIAILSFSQSLYANFIVVDEVVKLKEFNAQVEPMGKELAEKTGINLYMSLIKELDENQTIIVDSRPKKPKYDKGHIPSAISLPDSQFEKLQGKLPLAKSTPLIFYCGGFT